MDARKRYSQVRTHFYCVYECFWFLGKPCRSALAAFPIEAEAKKFADEKRKDCLPTSKVMIEELPCIIKAWDGNFPQS